MTGMRAASFATFGSPDVLRVNRISSPRAPRGDEILVRVAASSVNGTDLTLRRGEFKIALLGRRSFVPGFDIAGEVEACGPAVTAFVRGDRVMALLPHRGGGQAEFVLVRQGRAARVPSSTSLDAAAALPLAGLTALQALHAKAGDRLRPGARVLINGASGGIGSFAVQLAKLAGARVTGVASASKADFVRDLGADEVIDYAAQDVTQSDEHWDVIVDTPGRLSLPAARPILSRDGVLVSTRPVHVDALRQILPPALSGGNGRFTAVMTAARSYDLARLADLVDTGRLTVPVDSVVPLERVADAHRRAEGGAVGKVVVRVAR